MLANLDTGDLFEAVIHIISDVRSKTGDLPLEVIHLDSELGKDLALDSIDFIRCLVRMESQFAIICERSDYQGGPLKTVRNLVEIIRDRCRTRVAVKTVPE